MPWTTCIPANGHSDETCALAFFAACRATGFPILRATSKLSLKTPNEPPWPEQRHAAAAGIGHRRLDAILGEDRARRLADLRVIVVDEARREEDGLPLAEGGRGFIDRRRAALRAHRKGAAVEFRQRRLAVDAG